MAQNEIRFTTSSEEVFEVLSRGQLTKWKKSYAKNVKWQDGVTRGRTSSRVTNQPPFASVFILKWCVLA